MIRSKEYCDTCERIHGEESPKALIPSTEDWPAFPQLTWCYFKKGFQLLQTIDKKKKLLQRNWLGKVNRRELCVEHAHEFNIILKAYFRGDDRVQKLLVELDTDEKNWWESKQAKIRATYEALPEDEKGGIDNVNG